ncbi:unnamed protein product [Alternaria alternata]
MANIYRPLTGDDVRFVTLLPGAWTDPIQCKLVYLSLPNDQPDLVDVWFSSASTSKAPPKIMVRLTPFPTTVTPSYIALSYVWGEPGCTEEMLLNGQPVQKTVSLIAALRQLRALLGDSTHAPEGFGNHNIHVWVDALCIDQSNTTEKSIQVPRMGAIYGAAELVIAWVGHNDDDGIRGLMEIVNSFIVDEHLTLSNSIWRSVDSMTGDKVSYLIRGLERLLERPWFERVWVVQEAVMARRTLLLAASHWCHYHILEQVLVAVLTIHGNHPVVRTKIWSVARVLQYDNSRNVIHATIRSVSQKQPIASICAPGDSTGGKEAYVYREFLGAHNVTIRRSGVSVFDEWVDKAQKTSKNSQEAKELFRTRLFAFVLRNVLSSMHTTFLATIPHDYLYGVLSIGGSLGYPKMLAPNYRTPFAEVFHAYVMVILEHTGSVSIIPRLRRQLEGVPSWVPDFRSERVPMVITHTNTETALNTSRQVHVIENGRVCIVQGTILDDVISVSAHEHIPPHENTPYDTIIHYDRILESVCNIRQIRKDDAVTQFLEEAQGPTGNPESMKYLKAIYDDCISGKLIMSYDEDMLGDMLQKLTVETLASRITKFPLFITALGMLLALARDDEQPRDGDILVKIEGLAQPWLLRPATGSDEKDYVFVGACRFYYEDLLVDYQAMGEEQEFRLV